MESPKDKTGPRIVAAIDIGTNAIRMVVAQVLPDGRMEVLERMHRAVRLGQDAFLRQRLSQRTIMAAIAILRDYRRVLDSYQAAQFRAVATSAVREAANSDAFLDRVLMATNIEVEIIEPVEESRLTVNAVVNEMNSAEELRRGSSLIADVGGGGTLLTLLRGGQISASSSYTLGSVRLQELLATSEEPAQRAADLLRHHIASNLSTIKSSLPLAEVAHLIAVGGDARFVAAQVGRPSATGLSAVARKAFQRFLRKASAHTPAELSRIHGIPFADAETLVPALLVYDGLWQALAVDEMLVSRVSMRDGLLLDLTTTFKAEQSASLRGSILQSAKGIGEKYRYDAAHAGHVAELAARIFDVLRPEHHLADHERLLLQVAAILHDVGTYVGTSAHHKHSWYLISNSEVFGLRRSDLATVAQVARYHRRSPPKRTHTEYMSLPREKRMVVSKLAAILRVADALDRGHAQQVRDLRLERDPNELIISVAGVPDLTLERRALAGKADLFEDVYGLKVRLEEADAGPAPSAGAAPV